MLDSSASVLKHIQMNNFAKGETQSVEIQFIPGDNDMQPSNYHFIGILSQVIDSPSGKSSMSGLFVLILYIYIFRQWFSCVCAF